ncbi:MAG: sulfatase-like hydrolase/transferase [Ginsengibacter sp.]
MLFLLLATSLTKAAFYFYNYTLVVESGHHDGFKIAAWSLAYDLFTISVINLPFLFLLLITKKIPGTITSFIIRIIFCCLNTLMIVLNIIDIFYFRFYFQRANLGLLYVIDHPIEKLANLNILIIAGALLLLVFIVILIWKIQNYFYHSLMKVKGYKKLIITMAVILIVSKLFIGNVSTKIIPTYPLVNLSFKQLSVVQNSMHTLGYSLYRFNETLVIRKYFPDEYCDSALQVKKTFLSGDKQPARNIVLFIMESIPEDFFDENSPFNVRKPFFDSLLQHSNYFSNAYSYGLESNIGIVSILAGVPTLTSIPLYHTSYIDLPKTAVGSALKSKKYASFFCIGDTYDNFGFAKCISWLGFDDYYCDRDIPGYKQLPYGPVGIYDEYVLDFMRKKINKFGEPFLAVNYNTTTHYNFTLPPQYKVKFPPNYTDAMKSMSYYDSSLHLFFNASKKEKWFQNTVFIFCADHWASPDKFKTPANNLAKFRIPIIIYDPSVNKKNQDSTLVSQFDILGTMLDLGKYNDTAISYGTDLLKLDNKSEDKVIYNRLSDVLYQVFDGKYVLGYNTVNNKTEYLFNYGEDKKLSNDLTNDPHYSTIKTRLSDKLKIFYQKAIRQYYNKSLK